MKITIINLLLICSCVTAYSHALASTKPGINQDPKPGIDTTKTPKTPANNNNPPAAAPAAPAANPTSPAADDYAYDKVPVTYDLGTQTFDRVLPFDHPFTIHFTSIPTGVNYIEVTIIYDNTNKFVHHKSGVTYTDKSLSEYSTSYLLKRWERPAGTAGTNITAGDVHCRYKLSPNTSYTIQIETGVNNPLTDAQKADLKAKLAGNADINQAISDLASTAFNFNLDIGKTLNAENKRTSDLLQSAVTTVNPKYTLVGADPAQATAAFQDLLGNFQDIITACNQIRTFAAGKQAYSAADKTVGDQIAALSKVDWGKFKKNSDDYNKILKTVTAAQTAYKADANIKLVDNAVKELTTKLDQVETFRTAMETQIIEKVVLPASYTLSPLNDTYVDNFLKNAKLYVNLDMGYAYVFRIDRGLAYSGFNIYFRPINKSVPLSQYNTFGDWMSVRSSLLIGVTLGSVSETNVRKGFIGDQALVVGYGLKLVSFMKVNMGTLVHYRYDNNPLLSSNNYHTSLSPFISFSIDLDATALLSGIGTAIFK